MNPTPVSKTLPQDERAALDLPYRERTKAELLESLKKSMEQVLDGDYQPALEALDEIDSEAPDDAYAG